MTFKRVRFRVLIAGVVIVFVGNNAAFGQGVSKRQQDRFSLFNNCSPMMLSVRELDSQSTDFGLRKRNVERSVKSRLDPLAYTLLILRRRNIPIYIST